MLTPPAHGRAFLRLLCGLLGLLVPRATFAQTSVQATAGAAAGATDNAYSVGENTGDLPVTPGTYAIGSARLNVKNVTRRNALDVSYSLSAYKYFDPEDMTNTLTHVVSASDQYDLGLDQTFGIIGTFTKGTLNVLVPFLGSPPSTEQPPVVTVPDVGGAVYRQQGPLDYTSFNLLQSLDYRFDGKYVLRQAFAGTYFNPTEEDAPRPATLTLDAFLGLDRDITRGTAATSLLRLGNTRTNGYTLLGLEEPAREVSFAELTAGARREFHPNLSGQAAAGLYASFNFDNPSPNIGPAAHVEATYRLDPTAATARYEHTIVSSAITGDTFIADALRIAGSTRILKSQTIELLADVSFQRGHRVRDNQDVPGRVYVWTASAGVAWDPRGPLRFDIRGTSMYQDDKTGATEQTLVSRILKQNMVMLTMEATIPSEVETDRRTNTDLGNSDHRPTEEIENRDPHALESEAPSDPARAPPATTAPPTGAAPSSTSPSTPTRPPRTP